MIKIIAQYEKVLELEGTLWQLAHRCPLPDVDDVEWSLEWVAAMDELIAVVYDAGKAAA